MSMMEIIKLIMMILVVVELITLLVFVVTWNFGMEIEALPYILIGNAGLMLIMCIVVLITKIIQIIVG